MFLKPVKPFTTLLENLQELSISDMQQMVYGSIFSRGKHYYQNGHVLKVEQLDENKIVADVEGNDDSPYRVTLYLEKNDLRGHCSCPYDETCKHIVALLLKINQERELFQSMASKDEILKEYLEGLSKEELIELVMKSASSAFKEEIALKRATSEELNIRINEVAGSIQFDVNDEDLLYQPEAFLKAVEVHLSHLAMVVNSHPDEVFEIIFDLVDEIEEKYDNGYLYHDHYRYEEYFDFDTLSSQVVQLINKIENASKQAEMVVKFIEFNKRTSYMGINYSDFEVKDKRPLIASLPQIGNFDFYLYVKESLSFEEEEQFLLSYDAKRATIPLVTLYHENGNTDLAISVLEEQLEKEFTIEYVEKLLSLKEVSLQELEVFVTQAIKSNARDRFEFIVKHIQKFDNQKQLEEFFKKQSVDLYYRYLEQERRVAEMFELLGKLPHRKERFFIHYKEHYPSQAITFFRTEIEKQLEYTGDSHYHAIADALAHLKVLLSGSEFRTMVEKLKSDYKRRRNFVAILNNRFA